MGDFENRNPEGKIKENTAAAASDEKAGGENPKSGVPLRTYLIMILAGAYVAYLGVSLCQGVMKGAEGSSPGFMVAGVVFIVLGVIFVINGIRGSLKVSKAQKEQANAERTRSRHRALPTKAYLRQPPRVTDEKRCRESGKKMSIADRANLVSKLGDAREDEEEK